MCDAFHNKPYACHPEGLQWLGLILEKNLRCIKSLNISQIFRIPSLRVVVKFLKEGRLLDGVFLHNPKVNQEENKRLILKTSSTKNANLRAKMRLKSFNSKAVLWSSYHCSHPPASNSKLPVYDLSSHIPKSHS